MYKRQVHPRAAAAAQDADPGPDEQSRPERGVRPGRAEHHGRRDGGPDERLGEVVVRHDDIVPRVSALSASPSRRSQTMKTLLRTLANLLAGRRTPSIEEQYLAQAVDAQDLQVRLLALERARP